ncbi:MAG: transcription termination/antitermination protein NusG [Sphaerochaetaceae bacterium]|nr:transcription termination/antitermination protein NusG [Sphaerochaetaceae bacterium]
MAQGWYVVHTYSGYEQKIERMIRHMMETSEDFASACLDVKVPFAEHEKNVKDGNKKIVKEKILPGYILVELDIDSTNWKNYCIQIKRIQGVTGFLTASRGTMPQPLNKEEYTQILRNTGEIKGEAFKPRQVFSVGDKVRIIEGPFDQFAGGVEEINVEKSRLRVSVEIFGRPTPVDVEFSQVEKV